MIFRERLSRAQLVALAIAVVAVVVLTVEVGTPPVIALGLALSFALYGVVKKVVPADPRVSVGVEALHRDCRWRVAYLVVLHAARAGDISSITGRATSVLMMLAGRADGACRFCCSPPRPSGCRWSRWACCST